MKCKNYLLLTNFENYFSRQMRELLTSQHFCIYLKSVTSRASCDAKHHIVEISGDVTDAGRGGTAMTNDKGR